MRLNFFGDIVAPKSFTGEILLGNDLKNIIRSAEVNVVNFEAPSLSPLEERPSEIKKSGPNLYQDSNVFKWLSSNGFTHAALANNHMMDYGEKGLESTINSSCNIITTFGAGSWDDAYQPSIIQLENKKIAIFSLTHCEFGTLTDKWDDRYSCGTAWINHPSVDVIITNIRKTVDYIFVFAHAGLEYAQQPLPEWRDRYRSLIEIGCDGVIASHPHIIQGWEEFNGKPIIYSLGNLYFPKFQKMNPIWYKSICASIDIEGENVKLNITPLVFDSNVIDVDKSIDIQSYLNNVNKVLNDSSLYIEYVNTYCVEMLDNYYRLFEYGGLIRIKVSSMIKNILRKYLRRSSLSVPHLLNNIRCESHRYCICRALKWKYDIR